MTHLSSLELTPHGWPRRDSGATRWKREDSIHRASNDPVCDHEDSTWLEDWTETLDAQAYLDSLPSRVRTIHIFVGHLHVDNGVPTIDGFGGGAPNRSHRAGAHRNETALAGFITKCKHRGRTVKLTIGGHAGATSDMSWSDLTNDHLEGCAKALAGLCEATGADGIDFETELEDTVGAAKAGRLAAAFKALEPNLQASFCAHASYDPDSGPAREVDRAFLQNAVTSAGAPAIDRVYVMTYRECSPRENAASLLAWKAWLKKQELFSLSN